MLCLLILQEVGVGLQSVKEILVLFDLFSELSYFLFKVAIFARDGAIGEVVIIESVFKDFNVFLNELLLFLVDGLKFAGLLLLAAVLLLFILTN